MPRSSQTAESGWRRVFGGSVADVTAASVWVERIAASLKLPGKLTFAMQVCLEELMANITRHGKVRSLPTGTDGDNPLSISIGIDVHTDRIAMTIEDNGCPFDVEKAPAKTVDRPLEQVQPGGLGINLIKSFSNRIEYRRTDGGNRVIVDFMR